MVPIAVESYELLNVPRRAVAAERLWQGDMLTVTPCVATVCGSQGLVKLQFVKVRMCLRTIPSPKAMHGMATVLMHIPLAIRATLAKEPGKDVQQHARTLPR